MKGGEDLDAFDATARLVSEIIGYRIGGRIYHPADVEIMRAPPLTEAEYAATLPERIDRAVAELNEHLGELADVRFEFEPIDYRVAKERAR